MFAVKATPAPACASAVQRLERLREADLVDMGPHVHLKPRVAPGFQSCCECPCVPRSPKCSLPVEWLRWKDRSFNAAQTSKPEKHQQ